MMRFFKFMLLVSFMIINQIDSHGHTASFNKVMTLFNSNVMQTGISASEIKIDKNKDIIVVGSFSGTVDFDPSSSNTHSLTSVHSNGFIAKYDSNFNFKWCHQLACFISYFKNVELDELGNIYVSSEVGDLVNVVDFDLKSGVYNVSLSNYNPNAFGFLCVIAKYDSNLNFIWASNMSVIQVNDIEVDAQNNVIATGYIGGLSQSVIQIGGITYTSTDESDIIIFKINYTGSLDWFKQIEKVANGTNPNTVVQGSEGKGLQSDAFGNIFVVGSFEETCDFNPNSAVSLKSSIDRQDVFLLKLNAAGNFIWVNTFGNTGFDMAYSIAIDQYNQVVIAGEFSGEIDFDISSANHSIISPDFTDNIGIYYVPTNFVAKFNNDGDYIFAKAFGTTIQSLPILSSTKNIDIALDYVGNIYLTGYMRGIIDLDPGPNQYLLEDDSYNYSSLYKSAYISKLDNFGNFIWAKLLSATTTTSIEVNTIEVDSLQNVFTSGNFRETVDFNTESGVNNITAHWGSYCRDLFLHKISNCFTTAIDTQIAFGKYKWIDSLDYTSTNTTSKDTLVNVGGCDSIVILHLEILPVPVLNCNTPYTTNHQGKGLGWVVSNCASNSNGEEKMYAFTPTTTANYNLVITNPVGNYINWFYHDSSYGTKNTDWNCIGRTNIATTFSMGILTAGMTYYILGDAEGTIFSSQIISITSSNPSLPTVSTTTPLCGIATATLAVTNNPNATIEWYDAATGGNLLATNDTFITPTISATKNYWVQAVGGCGSTSARTQVTQIVNPKPEVTTTASNTKICKNSHVVLNGAGANTYTWSNGAFNNIPFPVSSTTIYTVTGTDANNCTNTATIEIEVKDLPAITINASQDTICNGDITMLSGNGGSAYSWSGGIFDQTPFIPTATTTYTVTGTGAYSCTNTATKTVVVRNCNLSMKIYLQGYYMGNGMMQNVLFNEGIEPYPSFNVDTVTVELHKYFSPYQLVETQKGILRMDGTLMVNFNADPSEEYYLVFKHRNHLQSWSSASAAFLQANALVNFTFSNGKTYGQNVAEVEPGIFAFFSGDINQDGYIDGADYPAYDYDSSIGLYGVYVATDLNGDGYVDGADYPLFDMNNSLGIFVIKP